MFQPATLLKVALLDWMVLRYLNCINEIKSLKSSHMFL